MSRQLMQYVSMTVVVFIFMLVIIPVVISNL